MVRRRLVDIHMHIHQSKKIGEWNKGNSQIWEYGLRPPSVRFTGYAGDVEDAVRAIADAGYDYAVAVNLFGIERARAEAVATLPPGLTGADRARAVAEIDATMPQRLWAFNRWVCEVAARLPQIIPFVAVDPWVFGPDENVGDLRELADRHGARGIKLHPVVQRFMPNDPRMRPVYRTCVELGLVVLSHSGSAKGATQYAEPRAFAEVLREFPDLTLVLAHLGGGSWRQTLELARAFPQVWFDCCEIIEWTGAPNAPTAEQLARLIEAIGPERVMMGTDFPWYDLGRTVERVMDLPLLAREEKEAILGANALRLLGVAGQ